MLLPGVSSSFIMVLIGFYATFMYLLSNLLLVTLIPFAFGVVVGAIILTSFIRWLINNYNVLFIMAITGFFIGSTISFFPVIFDLDLLFATIPALIIGIVISTFIVRLDRT